MHRHSQLCVLCASVVNPVLPAAQVWQNPTSEEPCPTVSTTSRNFAPSSTKRCSAAATSASTASSRSTIKPTSPARSAPKLRSSSASSPPQCCAATTASPTISCAVAKKAGSATRSSTL